MSEGGKDEEVDQIPEFGSDKVAAEGFHGVGLTGDFMTSSNKFTDYVEREKRVNVAKAALLVVAVLIAISTVLYLGYILVGGKPEPVEQPVQSQTATATPTDGSEDSEATPEPTNPDKPLLNLIDNPKRVKAGDRTVTVTAGAEGTPSVLEVDGTQRFSVSPEVVLSPTNEPCKVTRPTQFCHVANITMDGQPEAELFWLNDAAHSRFFERPSSFKAGESSSDLSVASAYMEITLSQIAPQPVFVKVGPEMDGLMVVSSSHSAVEVYAQTILSQ